jgi:hypothetical protein
MSILSTSTTTSGDELGGAVAKQTENSERKAKKESRASMHSTISVSKWSPPDPPPRQGKETIYALSVIGWGLAGAVAKVADRMRWLPGQKTFRYDIAGFVSLIKDWPPRCRAILHYPVGAGQPWASAEIDCINFTATNLPWLGVDHPITHDIHPDDGFVFVSWVCCTWVAYTSLFVD